VSTKPKEPVLVLEQVELKLSSLLNLLANQFFPFMVSLGCKKGLIFGLPEVLTTAGKPKKIIIYRF